MTKRTLGIAAAVTLLVMAGVLALVRSERSSAPGGRVRAYHPGVYLSVATFYDHGRAVGRETEWIDTRAARFRLVDPDGVVIFRPGSYERDSPGGRRYVRIGSSEFLGSLNRLGVVAFVRYRMAHGVATAAGGRIRFRDVPPGGKAFDVVVDGTRLARVRVVRRIPDARAAALFRVRPAAETAVDRQVPLGAPQPQLAGFWFGPDWRGRTGTLATVHLSARVGAPRPGRPRDASYVVLYDPAGVRPNPAPGIVSPAGEVQVITIPRTSSIAERRLRTLRRAGGGWRWPAERLVLADGTRALAIRTHFQRGPSHTFDVITGASLISVTAVHGLVDWPLRALAQLRAVGR